jgi:hypothetical protein
MASPTPSLGYKHAKVGVNENPSTLRRFEGEVVFARPFRAHVAPLNNAPDIRGKIAIVTRDPPEIAGGARCGFDAKVAHCKAAGAIGVLIVNTSDDVPTVFVEVNLPVAMISTSYARRLKNGEYVSVDGSQVHHVYPSPSNEKMQEAQQSSDYLAASAQEPLNPSSRATPYDEAIVEVRTGPPIPALRLRKVGAVGALSWRAACRRRATPP